MASVSIHPSGSHWNVHTMTGVTSCGTLEMAMEIAKSHLKVSGHPVPEDPEWRCRVNRRITELRADDKKLFDRVADLERRLRDV